MFIKSSVTQKNCIIVPCFNEAKRLDTVALAAFVQSNGKDFDLLFVNDGSTDQTKQLLHQLYLLNPNTINVITNDINIGKAESIRKGVLFALQQQNYQYIGFLDADLATPITELVDFWRFAQFHENYSIITGCRLKRLGADIKRKRYRHLIGRVFSTFASILLQLPVYDTQCGAKLFNARTASLLFAEPFITSWLFDVELIARLKKIDPAAAQHIYEYPVSKWHDISGSKIRLKHMLGVPFDLIRIYLKY